MTSPSHTRRWFQFGIGTLMVSTACFAIAAVTIVQWGRTLALAGVGLESFLVLARLLPIAGTFVGVGVGVLFARWLQGAVMGLVAGSATGALVYYGLR